MSASRLAVRTIAVLYLVGIWLEGVGCSITARVVPRPAKYFLEVAALFPDKASASSEYRAEGWLCGKNEWKEVDTRAYFPLDPDDKENRFQRALHFYYDTPAVPRALDAYLVQRHNRSWLPDGIPEDEPIGGIRILLAREPIPKPGREVKRYVRRPLDDFPDAHKHVLYQTKDAVMAKRCAKETEDEVEE